MSIKHLELYLTHSKHCVNVYRHREQGARSGRGRCFKGVEVTLALGEEAGEVCRGELMEGLGPSLRC